MNEPPCCPTCGCEMEWVDCSNGCDEGEVNRYHEDPLWYGSEDEAWERCPVCNGRGGRWVCPVCHPDALD